MSNIFNNRSLCKSCACMYLSLVRGVGGFTTMGVLLIGRSMGLHCELNDFIPIACW